MKLYEACLTLLQVYSKNSSRKRSDSAAEEDQYQDLLLIMELLTNLLSKEFIDFSDTGEGRTSRPGHVLAATAAPLWRSVLPPPSRRRVQKPGPGNAGVQPDRVGSRCGSLRGQHRSAPHDAGPAEGENLRPLRPVWWPPVLSEGLILAFVSSSPLCVTSTTSSSPSSVRSSLRRSHSCQKTSSKASCFPWSWE